MVPQTFNDVLAILGTAVDRADLAPSYPDYINRAVRDIASAHSFEQMKATGTVTLPNGQATVALPANWKEPQNGRFSSVFAAIGAAALVAIPIYERTEIERLAGVFLPNPYLLYTQDNQAFQLGLFPPAVAAANWVISLYYFAYPDVVTDMTQGTPLLTFYPNLVLSKTLSLIFQSINDPIWQTHEQAFRDELQRVTGVDLGAVSTAAQPQRE